jgi:hypothetical protein
MEESPVTMKSAVMLCGKIMLQKFVTKKFGERNLIPQMHRIEAICSEQHVLPTPHTIASHFTVTGLSFLWCRALSNQILRWRAATCRELYLHHIASKMIQAKWRGSVGRKEYVAYMAARKLQTSWRAYVCRRDFIEYFAATIIQAKSRAFVVRADYLRYKAAAKIQSTWRSYDCQMNYFNFLADILIMVVVRVE